MKKLIIYTVMIVSFIAFFAIGASKIANSDQLNKMTVSKQPAIAKDTVTTTPHTTTITKTTTTPKTVPVFEVDTRIYDAQMIPPLLITELVPDSKNVNGADGFEFIELYNNSDQPIDLQHYTIRYRAQVNGRTKDIVWHPTNKNIALPSKATLVYWIVNKDNIHLTLKDFNDNYGTKLTSKQVVKIYADGMSNSLPRQIVVSTNTGIDVAIASYNQANKDDTVRNKGILYTYPVDSSIHMMKYEHGKTKGTPGVIATMQVPMKQNPMEMDLIAPTYQDMTPQQPIAKFEDRTIQYQITDNDAVKTVQLFYKYANDTKYRAIYLEKQLQNLYTYMLKGTELLNKGHLEYYVKLSDGQNTLTTEKHVIDIETSFSKTTGVNLTDGAVVSGKVAVESYGKNNRLFINKQDITNNTIPMLQGKAYFVLQVKETNLYFQNAVTMNDEILKILDDRLRRYETIVVPIAVNSLRKGKPATISVRAGTKESPFDEQSSENRDDFVIKNVHLVLEDGTVVNPLGKHDKKALAVGDDVGAKKVYDFSFKIPDKYFTARLYDWDTTALRDGNYTVSSGKEAVTIAVDNTAPRVTTSVQQGKMYKGDFDIAAEAIDQSTVQFADATLDDKVITLPYKTSSAKLSPGEHTLIVKATDIAGNVATTTVQFSTLPEMPDVPEISSAMVNDKLNVNVKVTDPTEDHMSVQFYEGYKYQPTDANMRVFANASTTEPPQQLASTDDVLVEDTLKMATADGAYVDVSDTTKFPYHRFEVEVDSNVNADDEIFVQWIGKSLPGRKVSMYIWNYAIEKWERQDWSIPVDTLNFELQATFLASNVYVKDHEVQVLVQDEVATTATSDYSFVWMSDTQYYAESYPHIYHRMTEWIAQQRDKLGIKYVFHTGDLVDESVQSKQWVNADAAMRTLEKFNIPYGVLAGNHDVNLKMNDYGPYSKYFGAHRFAQQSFYGESYKDNRGHYDVIHVNGNTFLMLYMGWGISEQDIAWMNEVLADNPHAIVFLNVHEYLSATGTRSAIGNTIFEKIVKPNRNIVAVLSGHYHGAETLVDTLDDNDDGVADRKVYQMLADYQGGVEGGQGYMRLFKVNQAANKIAVETYSPYVDDYNYYDPAQYPGKDQFEMDIDLVPEEKLVSTDAFKVQVFTNSLLQEFTDIASGQTVEAVLDGENGWYVNVTDAYGGRVRSDVRSE